MNRRNEWKVAGELLSLSGQQMKAQFVFREEDGCYYFEEIGAAGHYVSVQKGDRGRGPFIPVNANFGFVKTTDSNNCPPFREVGLHLVHAFGLTVDWA